MEPTKPRDKNAVTCCKATLQLHVVGCARKASPSLITSSSSRGVRVITNEALVAWPWYYTSHGAHALRGKHEASDAFTDTNASQLRSALFVLAGSVYSR
jgi:hypothetical protein